MILLDFVHFPSPCTGRKLRLAPTYITDVNDGHTSRYGTGSDKGDEGVSGA